MTTRNAHNCMCFSALTKPRRCMRFRHGHCMCFAAKARREGWKYIPIRKSQFGLQRGGWKLRSIRRKLCSTKNQVIDTEKCLLDFSRGGYVLLIDPGR